MNYNTHGNETSKYINPNQLYPLPYTTNYSQLIRSPILKNQGRSLSAREYQVDKSSDSFSTKIHGNSKSFECTETEDYDYMLRKSSEVVNSNKTTKYFKKHSLRKDISPYRGHQKQTLSVSYLPNVGNISPRILPNSPKQFSSNYDIKRPSELCLFQYDDVEESGLNSDNRQSFLWNRNFLYPTTSFKIMRSTSCRSTPNQTKFTPPTNDEYKNYDGPQYSSSNDLNIIDFLYNVRSFEEEKNSNDNGNIVQKSSSNLFFKRATRSVAKKMAQLKMGQKESRLQKSTNNLCPGFSNSFDNSYIDTSKKTEKTKNHINNSSRTNSTNSDDSYAIENKSSTKAGSSGSLNIFTKNKHKKSDYRVQNGIRSSSATSKSTSNKRNVSPPKLIAVKKLAPISSSSQEIIRYCMENVRGDIASRIVSRMAHKREDFAMFITNLSTDQLNEFTGALRDYMNQVLKHVHSTDKIREISMQFGILQVSRREWGFKADFFACMANSITTECVFLDGAAHQPTEAIEAWAELVELMFTNIREGYYQQIRYLRRRSQCFSGYFSQSQDASTYNENASDSLNYLDSANDKTSTNDINRRILFKNSKEENYRHPWTMHRQMSESGCYGERPKSSRTRYNYNTSKNSPIEPVMSPGVIINIKN
uniref:Guanylate cyclase domain-containing protein n=1 Tax=Strongyloides venezuelensis TaxID=75913 RepID=A0A0K0F722_STRVS